ncbi:general stress protein [Brumimicrobium glaciale]|uniref:General stress protein n=1 Tax=Brumimicrobium glaciale TaxID=200475 RepID=A0A4Q4KEF9_9FLAO|nr:pyridoxamine 5'-phosphate oxidase family protein [Brumimicrobium glaciale]RYM30847.1 general stress protein [Brumimicrobium glaciale]
MSEKNLNLNESRKKLKELVESIDFAMFTSNLSKPPFHTVPMSTKKVDINGNLWFLSGRTSQHNINIQIDEKVLLNYANSGDFEFLTVYATAKIVNDKAILEDLYGKADDAWFDGVEDPNLTAICVAPEDAHYWEAKSGKLVSLLKMGVGAITGKQPDMGKEGDLAL